MSIDPRSITPPEMWTTYSDIEQVTRDLLLETDRATKDGPRLDAFVEKITTYGVHGAWAAGALTWCSLDVLADVMGVRPATTIALISRVVPWRDSAGVTINSLLAALGGGGHSDVFRRAQQVDELEGPGYLARGLGQRMIFATEAAGLLSSRSSSEVAAEFVEAFFTDVR